MFHNPVRTAHIFVIVVGTIAAVTGLSLTITSLVQRGKVDFADPLYAAGLPLFLFSLGTTIAVSVAYHHSRK